MILFLPLKLPRRFFLFGLAFLLLLFSFFSWLVYQKGKAYPAQALLPLSGLTMGLDPGHGGYDPGSMHGEAIEKDIVLEISLYLRDYLQQGGASVIMTRETDMDLLELPVAGPKKRQDLHNRLAVLESSQVDLLVSVHANSFSTSYWRGAQTFYQDGKENGRRLAVCMQDELARVLRNTDRVAKSGNFFLLRELDVPGAIVEVGFLSNPEEARLLLNPNYQKKIAWAIYTGIIKYYSQE